MILCFGNPSCRLKSIHKTIINIWLNKYSNYHFITMNIFSPFILLYFKEFPLGLGTCGSVFSFAETSKSIFDAFSSIRRSPSLLFRPSRSLKLWKYLVIAWYRLTRNSSFPVRAQTNETKWLGAGKSTPV